jgi:hypothetical protein
MANVRSRMFLRLSLAMLLDPGWHYCKLDVVLKKKRGKLFLFSVCNYLNASIDNFTLVFVFVN